MDRRDTIRAMILRRRVLVALRGVQGGGYPGWLRDRAIFDFLKFDPEDFTFQEIKEAGAYLAGKGYVETKDRREDKFSAAEFDGRILPKGIDLLEETIPPDPGVEDNRQ